MGAYRSNYFRDYEAVKVPAKNRKGYRIQYEYIGDWCVWNEDARAFEKRKRIYAAGGIFAILLMAACGLRRVEINASAFVAIPGLAALVGLMYAVIGTVQICLAGIRVRARDRKGMSSRFTVGHAVSAAGLLLSAAGGLAALFANGARNAGWDSVLVIAGYLAASATSWLLYKYHRSLGFHTEPGKRSPEA